MGSWQLESVKMFIYVMFPVCVFHVFNQPEIFKDWVTKIKERHFTDVSEEYAQELKRIRLAHQRRIMEEKES